MGEQTMRPERHLAWEACYNVRDLGGLPLAGGGETRWRSVVRSDLLVRLTPAGWSALREYGIRTVIDLRGPHELVREPYDSPDGVRYLNLPLEAYEPRVSERIAAASNRAEVYAIILDEYPSLAARAMRAIAEAGPEGVLVHCHAGKDRTGIISALLLSLAGVDEETIAADYGESQLWLRPLEEAEFAAAAEDEQADFWLRRSATPDMMRGLLDHLRKRYGGVERYLRQAGLSPDEIARLRGRLLRDA